MKPISLYRWIAGVNAVIGVFVAVGFFAVIFALIKSPPSPAEVSWYFIAGTGVVMAVMSVGLISTAVLYFKNPIQRFALSLAVNSSVILFFVLGAITKFEFIVRNLGPAYVLFDVLFAYLIYRLILKPLALKINPTDEKNGA
jgi:hypothetical protein